MRVAIACLVLLPSVGLSSAVAEKPNVLFIAIDDLNDWVGHLGGNDQTITSNLDRFASSGVTFTNAHCAAPACNSRISESEAGTALTDTLPN